MGSEDEESSTHLLHTVCLSDSLCVKIHRSVGESGLIGSLIVNDEELKFSGRHKLDFKYKPEVNALVSALHGTKWYRGSVLEKTDRDVKVALVDYGTIIKPKALCRLPPEDGSICGTAVRVSFLNGIPNLSDLIGTKIKVSRIDEIEDDIIFCNFETFGDAYIIPWEPRFEDMPEKSFELESNMETTVSTFYTTRSVYLQPFDQSELVKILDNLRDHCEQMSSISRLPFCGELVACLYAEDAVYYRAKVLKIESGQFYVRFVDFGTYETFGMENIFTLPEDIKEIPYQAIKVGLAGLPNSNFNCPATQLLNILTLKQIPLQLLFERDLNNVKLLTESGTINDKLEDCMKPFMTRNLKGLNPGKIFKKHDLIYEKWKVGDELPIEIFELPEDNQVLTKSSKFIDDTVFENLTEEINAHCENFLSVDFYIPSVEEVCLGKCDVGWCRAICVQVFGEASVLFFIDYGTRRKIPNADIRPITYEFMRFPVYLKECVFYGLDDLATLKMNFVKEFQLHTLDAVVVDDIGRKVVVFVRKLNEFLKQNKLPEIIQPPICNL